MIDLNSIDKKQFVETIKDFGSKFTIIADSNTEEFANYIQDCLQEYRATSIVYLINDSSARKPKNQIVKHCVNELWWNHCILLLTDHVITYENIMHVLLSNAVSLIMINKNFPFVTRLHLGWGAPVYVWENNKLVNHTEFGNSVEQEEDYIYNEEQSRDMQRWPVRFKSMWPEMIDDTDHILTIPAVPIEGIALTHIYVPRMIGYIKDKLASGKTHLAFLAVDETVQLNVMHSAQRICDILYSHGCLKPGRVTYWTADEKGNSVYTDYYNRIKPNYKMTLIGQRTFEYNAISMAQQLTVDGNSLHRETLTPDLIQQAKELMPFVSGIRKKYFLCLNRMPRSVRLQLIAFLIRNNILEQTYSSLYLTPEDLQDIKRHLIPVATQHINEAHKWLEEFDPVFWQNILNDSSNINHAQWDKVPAWVNIKTDVEYRGKTRVLLDMQTLVDNEHLFPMKQDDPDTMSSNPVTTNTDIAYMYQGTYFSIVNETIFNTVPNMLPGEDPEIVKAQGVNIKDALNYQIPVGQISHNNGLFFSEKTFRPIHWKQPFILFAQPGALAQLRKSGYKTFGDFIDESYDDELCDTKRLFKLEQLIMSLSNKKHSEMAELMEKLKPICEHNFNHFLRIDRKLGIYPNNINKYLTQE